VKLKLSLESAGQDRRDLVATIDSATTVGDLATYLARADPQAGPVPPAPDAGAGDRPEGLDHESAGGCTLSLADQNHFVVDPRLTILESGLRSGAVVAVTDRHDAGAGSSVSAERRGRDTEVLLDCPAAGG